MPKEVKIMIIKQTLIFANSLCNSKQTEQPRGQNYNAEGGRGGEGQSVADDGDCSKIML